MIDTHTPIAPYTRETLALVRGLSRSFSDIEIAARMNWDLAFLRSIAGRHDISLLRVVPIAPKEEEAPPAATPARRVTGNLEWNARTCELKRGDHVITLPVAQALCFEALFHCLNEGAPPISIHRMATHLGQLHPRETIARLRRRLIALNVFVVSKSSLLGRGYALEVRS
jgi:hypothetical protein